MPTMPTSTPQGEIQRLRIAYPQLFVADVERSAAFFRDKLGFGIDYLYGQPPFYGLVSRDGVGLNLRHMDAPVIDPTLREREVLLSAAIVMEGIEELFQEYQNRKVDFAQTLSQQPWGSRDFVVRDPDGNLICFASRVLERE